MAALKPGQEMSRDTKPHFLILTLFYLRVVLQPQLCLLQRFIFLLARLDAGSCQARGSPSKELQSRLTPLMNYSNTSSG